MKCLERKTLEGESPVKIFVYRQKLLYEESHSLGVECKYGDNFHQRLNNNENSIEKKYHEGTLKSTSRGECKDLKSLKLKESITFKSKLLEIPSQWTFTLIDVELFLLVRF